MGHNPVVDPHRPPRRSVLLGATTAGALAVAGQPPAFAASPTWPRSKAWLDAALDTVAAQQGVRLGIAWWQPGPSLPPSVGNLLAPWARSTYKVPLAIAGMTWADSTTMRSLVTRLIRYSDNTAADPVRDLLGGYSRAADLTNVILRRAGDGVTVLGKPNYSQVPWSLSRQAILAHGMFALPEAAFVLTQMRNITASQAYGIGRYPAACFKGGWGPRTGGGYMVRQLGSFTIGGRPTYVSVGAETTTYARGIAAIEQALRYYVRICG